MNDSETPWCLLSSPSCDIKSWVGPIVKECEFSTTKPLGWYQNNKHDWEDGKWLSCPGSVCRGVLALRPVKNDTRFANVLLTTTTSSTEFESYQPARTVTYIMILMMLSLLINASMNRSWSFHEIWWSSWRIPAYRRPLSIILSLKSSKVW
jgi:hypothetical protein